MHPHDMKINERNELRTRGRQTDQLIGSQTNLGKISLDSCLPPYDDFHAIQSN